MTAQPADKHQATIFCQIVAQLLIADAKVTDEERDFLERLMDRFGFDAADRQAVFNGVDIGDPVDSRVASLTPDLRAGLVAELEAAATIDGDVAPGERAVLEDVRRALERTPA